MERSPTRRARLRVARAVEKSETEAEVREELIDLLKGDEHQLYHECRIRCDLCGVAGLHITEVKYHCDADVMVCVGCTDQADMLSLLNDTFASELDLADPWISVRG